MESDLKGKNIVVTGAGQGIGKDVCERLYSLGANVFAISRSAGPLNKLKQLCPGVTILQLDLGDWTAARTGLIAFLKHVNKIDGLVNNAGIASCKPIEELTEKDFDDMMNVNVKALFNCTQALIPYMKDGGSIVNLSSLASLCAFADHAFYSASKAAVDSFTKSFALELGPRKIRCNSVNPTVVLTAMGQAIWSDPIKSNPLKDRIPLHRFAELKEVTDPIIFLLSDKSSFINGHTLPIDGGFSAC